MKLSKKEKPQIPTTQTPTESNKFYFRIAFRVFFFGPFNTEEEVSMAMSKLDVYDPMWDYDSYCIIYGKSPLPIDFVFGFPFVDSETRDRIENGRKVK